MNELGCIIVDDEFQNRETLSIMLEQVYPSLKILGKADCVLAALELIQDKKPNIVFLDVEMPGGNGFKLFDIMPATDFLVIFTTAHAEYAIKAIKFAALDYLLKPLDPIELKTSVENAVRKITDTKSNVRAYEYDERQIEILRENQLSGANFQKIAVPTGDGIQFLEIGDIIQCEADRAYCVFHLTNKSRLIASKSLKDYELILESANFFRVHKSNMINLDHVKRYIRGKGGQIIMSNGMAVGVSTRKKELLLNVLTDRSFNR